MKTILFTCVVLLACVSMVWGQEPTRPFKLKAVTEKGKPFRGGRDAFVYVSGDSVVRSLDKKGICVLPVQNSDTVYLVFSDYAGVVPVAGLDSVSMLIDETQIDVEKPAGDEMIDTGYGFVRKSTRTFPTKTLDTDKMPKITYNTLADMIHGQLAGVRIVDGNVYVRGHRGSNKAIFVVDGVPYGGFNTVSYINPQIVKSINLDNSGTMYGVRGANGVIVITTKRGGEK